MKDHPQARLIVDTLAQAGFIAYYAGGWVRDFLLNHPSDDIDIATNAPPEALQTLFPHTAPIGISFGIVLVIIDGHPYEVATFRQDLDYRDGRRPSKVEFSTAEEDAKRRDFTINGMFYDPIQGKIFDFVDGVEDLKRGVIRAIGNPHDRIQEDRLRMIRAVRLACRFGFTIDPATEKAIRAHAKELFPAVAIERICQEFDKGLAFKKLQPMLFQLHDLGLLPSIFPSLHEVPLREIETRLKPLAFFPDGAPLIAHLFVLFPAASNQEKQDLCKQLKRSKSEFEFAAFLDRSKELFAQEGEPCEWAHFYAHSSADLAIHIFAAYLDPSERATFLAKHQMQIEKLKPYIEQIQKKEPFLHSSDLLQAGIQPGKEMGRLLREGEKIAINEGICGKESIIRALKEKKLWPM